MQGFGVLGLFRVQEFRGYGFTGFGGLGLYKGLGSSRFPYSPLVIMRVPLSYYLVLIREPEKKKALNPKP